MSFFSSSLVVKQNLLSDIKRKRKERIKQPGKRKKAMNDYSKGNKSDCLTSRFKERKHIIEREKE